MDNEGGRFRIIKLIVSLAALSLITLSVMAQGYKFYLKDKEMRKRIESGEFNDYHNQPHNIYNAPIVYFRSDLERVVGVRLRESKMKMAGYTCNKYWNNGNEPTKYDRLRFYIFDKERHAKKVLEKIKKNSFCEITDEGDNYVRGWLDGVVDARIENYYYLNGNLLVEATVTSVDESARDVNDPTSPVMGGGQYALDLIEMINTTF